MEEAGAAGAGGEEAGGHVAFDGQVEAGVAEAGGVDLDRDVSHGWLRGKGAALWGVGLGGRVEGWLGGRSLPGGGLCAEGAGGEPCCESVLGGGNVRE